MYSPVSGRSDVDLFLTGQIIELQPRFQFPRQQAVSLSRRELKRTFEVRPARAAPKSRPRSRRPWCSEREIVRASIRLKDKKAPLTMSTMSMPGAGQTFHDQEDCQVLSPVTIDRLLGSQTRPDIATTPVDVDASQYLQDTYDYLFNRHVQTLNGVIDQHQQKLRIHCELEQEEQVHSNTDEDSESSGCASLAGVDVVIMHDGGQLSLPAQ